MARMKKGSVSRHEYFVRIVTARWGNGEATCLTRAMSFRGEEGFGS